MTENERNVRRFREYITPDVVNDDGVKWLLNKGFFSAPASTKYHGSYEGGLFDHSYHVARVLVSMTNDLGLSWDRERSPYIIGIFHDLCKIDQYVHPIGITTMDGKPVFDRTKYEYNKDTLLKGHGDKSVMLLSQLMQLTEEEIMCIRYHMGAFTDKEEWPDYTRAVREYPNVLWTHTADMMASHVIGV